jgi:type II secretory pathway pseudopilin PulG
VRFAGRLRALLESSESGFTLVELVASMAVMMTVMGGLTALMVSGTNAEVNMNKRFQAQTEARLGLDKLRRDVHCSYDVSPFAVTQVTLKMSASCPTSGGSTTITWCTVVNGNHYGLWRYTGTACSGVTGRKIADWLTNTSGSAFTYTAPVAGSKELKKLGVSLAVNLTPTKLERVYKLDDSLVLRNSVRA